MLVHCCSAEQPQLSYLPPSRVNSNPPVVPVLGGQLITKLPEAGPLGFGW